MSDSNFQPQYSRKEETANIITHGIGILASIVGLIFLVILAQAKGDQWHLVSFAIFGISLLLMYTSSSLYHSVSGDKAKRYLRKLDHSVIYILIAGTYTPYLLTNLRGTTGWIMFVVVWTFAAVGIIIKLATQIKSKWVSAVIYLGMGWLAIFIAPSMVDNLSTLSIIFLLAGGLFYSIGVIFYVRKRLPYHHAVWHLFVLGGSICHYFSVYHIL
jgi:hemolysin III